MSVLRLIQAILLVGFCFFLFIRCFFLSPTYYCLLVTAVAGWLKFNHSRMRKEEGLSMLHKNVRVDPQLDF